MTVNKYIISFLIILSMMIHNPAEAADDKSLIRINGSSSIVDVSDILARKSGVLSESDIKKICAEITGRYHDMGYSSFYIEKAVRNEDGTVDLLFKESMVTAVNLSGMGEKSDDAASALFTIGDFFNEFVLKEKISLTKKRFNLKQLNVTITRGEDDSIILSAVAVERIHEFYTSVYGSPVYGIMPALAYRLSYGGVLSGITLVSSFNQNERSYRRGSVFLNSDNVPGNPYFTLSADIVDRKDSYGNNGELIYTHRSLSPEAGFYSYYGAAGLGVFVAGTFNEFENYHGEDEGALYSGMHLKFNYNDTPYKISYGDITKAEADYYSGWNQIEKKISSKIVINYLINFSLLSEVFISLNGHFFYTTDSERFARVYVFDNTLPCRSEDFSSASLRNISGIDFNYEILKRAFYAAPVFKWGIYNSGSENEVVESVLAAGVKIYFISDKIRMEASYLFETGNSVKSGSFLFSATAVY